MQKTESFIIAKNVSFLTFTLVFLPYSLNPTRKPKKSEIKRSSHSRLNIKKFDANWEESYKV